MKRSGLFRRGRKHVTLPLKQPAIDDVIRHLFTVHELSVVGVELSFDSNRRSLQPANARYLHGAHNDSFDGFQVRVLLQKRCASLLAQVRREFIQRLGAPASCFMRARVKRIAKVDKDDFREVRIETTQLIESLLNISLLHHGRRGIYVRDRRRDPDVLLCLAGKPIDEYADDDDVDRNSNDRMLNREPNQESDQRINKCAAATTTAAAATAAATAVRLAATYSRDRVSRQQTNTEKRDEHQEWSRLQ